jgi:DNA-binding NtrC family response regulator
MSLYPRTIDHLTPPVKANDVFPRIRSPRILVVEDDPAIIPLVTRALVQLDPDIVLDWAFNAEDARSALASGGYEAVLADFVLADSDSGYSLLSECREYQPNARFAMMSSLPIAPPEKTAGFLRKPFAVSQCRSFLADLLDGTN